MRRGLDYRSVAQTLFDFHPSPAMQRSSKDSKKTAPPMSLKKRRQQAGIEGELQTAEEN